MNDRFIESCHYSMMYEKKPETKGSFYQSAGKRGILPNRISWGINAFSKTSNKLKGKINEINGQYKVSEEGLYKELNQGKFHTSIWGFPLYPEFYGYGIFDERHDLYDLVIVHSENICSSSMDIHIFRGLGKLEYQEAAFNYLRNLMKKPH